MDQYKPCPFCGTQPIATVVPYISGLWKGRLVYNWDVIRCDDVQAIVNEPIHPRFGRGFNYRFRFNGISWDGHVLGSNAEVDLVASPQRCYYDRYFADLGTLDQVRALLETTCDDIEWPAETFSWLEAPAVYQSIGHAKRDENQR